MRRLVAILLLGLLATPIAAEENPFARFGVARNPTGTKLSPAIIPALFRGEWNSDIKACGTGMNDSRLVVSGRRVSFFESDGDVKIVWLHNSRAITVQATYAGEGQVWDRVDRMVLSRSGNQLTITSVDTPNREASSFTRFRCPVRKK